MNILCIETAFFSQTSVALVQIPETENAPSALDSASAKVDFLPLGKTQGETLMPLIAQLLESHQLNVHQLRAIVVDTGPGSFTGIRIGLATAQAMAMACDLALYGVSSLQSLAIYSSSEMSDENSLLCPVIDARKGEIYTGLYKFDGKNLQSVIDEVSIKPSNWMARCKEKISSDQKILFMGEGVFACEKEIKTLQETLPVTLLTEKDQLAPPANNLLKLVWQEILQKNVPPVNQIKPRYLRPVNQEFTPN